MDPIESSDDDSATEFNFGDDDDNVTRINFEEADELPQPRGLAVGTVVELHDDKIVIEEARGTSLIISHELTHNPSYAGYWPQEEGEVVTLVGDVKRVDPFTTIFDPATTVVKPGSVTH